MYYNAFQAQKIVKKVLALVLALMMVVSLMVSANAAVTFDDAADINPQYQEAVEVLQTLGIMQGVPTEVPATEEGAEPTTVNNFQPKTPLTRAQFAVILFKLATGDDGDEEAYEMYKAQNIYSDVPSTNYAAAHINYLNKIDAMHGIGGGKFDPDREVTGYEVVQGLLQALGYGKLGEFGDTWEEAKLVTAAYGTSKHITTGLGIDIRKVVTREELAALLFNAMTQPEAHIVTAVTSDGKHYAEEVASKDNWVTIGESNWELHLYNPASGKTYPSDKTIKIDLDPFGRPTNPKWVAVVKGQDKPITIGTEDKALLSYYDDAVTRKDLMADFYREYAFKDDDARIEYYVDGLEVDDPWMHQKGYHIDKPVADPVTGKETGTDPTVSDFDTIGGKGVTVEVYLMRDKLVAISKDLLGRDGYTQIGDKKDWPKMRVVIVHHYAAQITSTMMVPNTTAPSYLRLPYDYREVAKCGRLVDSNGNATSAACGESYVKDPVSKEVRLYIDGTSNKATYEKDDVIFFEVSIAEKANGEKTYTVRNDRNLTKEESYVKAHITARSPIKGDGSYIRVDDENYTKPLYFNYFTTTTKYEQYQADRVKDNKTTEQTVYLDPLQDADATNRLVTLVVTPVEKTPVNVGDYYYVEDVELRYTGHSSYTFDENAIEIRATLVNVTTGVRTKDTLLDFEVEKNDDGYLITEIAGNVLKTPLSFYVDPATQEIKMANGSTENGHLNLSDAEIVDTPSREYQRTPKKQNPFGIPEANFTGTTLSNYKFVKYDRSVSETPKAIEKNAKDVISSVEWYILRSNKGGTDTYLAPYSDQALKTDVSIAYPTSYEIWIAVINHKDGTSEIMVLDQIKTEKLNNYPTNPVTTFVLADSLSALEKPYADKLAGFAFGTKYLTNTTIDPSLSTYLQNNVVRDPTLVDVPVGSLLGTLADQFVIKTASKHTGFYNLEYDMDTKNVACWAYDDDASHRDIITSGIFRVNETSSRIVITNDTDDYADLDPAQKNIYEIGEDTEVVVAADTLVYAYSKTPQNTPTWDGYDWSWDTQVHTVLTGPKVYHYNQFDRFGFNDQNPEVLVVYYYDSNTNAKIAKYVIVIVDDAYATLPSDATYTFYGIYCGFDDYYGSAYHAYFLDPRTNTISAYDITASDWSSISVLNDKDNVGQVFGLTVSGTTATLGSRITPEKVVNVSEYYNYIYTESGAVANLHGPQYYLVTLDNNNMLAGNTAYNVDAEMLQGMMQTGSVQVAVCPNANGTTTVVIYADNVLESLHDGLAKAPADWPNYPHQ